MTYRCPDCKLDVDKPGRCINCRRAHSKIYFEGVKHYKCVFCGAPFPEGKVHQKCYQKMLVRCSKGLGAPSYWRVRKTQSWIKRGPRSS